MADSSVFYSEVESILETLIMTAVDVLGVSDKGTDKTKRTPRGQVGSRFLETRIRDGVFWGRLCRRDETQSGNGTAP